MTRLLLFLLTLAFAAPGYAFPWPNDPNLSVKLCPGTASDSPAAMLANCLPGNVSNGIGVASGGSFQIGVFMEMGVNYVHALNVGAIDVNIAINETMFEIEDLDSSSASYCSPQTDVHHIAGGNPFCRVGIAGIPPVWGGTLVYHSGFNMRFRTDSLGQPAPGNNIIAATIAGSGAYQFLGRFQLKATDAARDLFASPEGQNNAAFVVTAPDTGAVHPVKVQGMSVDLGLVALNDPRGNKADTIVQIAVLKFDCSDDLDNDGDGLIDYPEDPDCASVDDNSEQAGGGSGSCGLGPELALVIPLLAAVRRRKD